MKKNKSQVTSPATKSLAGRHKSQVRIILALFLMAHIFGCAKREIKNMNSKGKNIICFGDSITFGYGAQAGEDYPTVLSKMLHSSVINAGVNGESSSDALKRLDADVLQKDPYLVIVELGANDFIKKDPIDITTANVKSIVERIQAKGAMVAIVDVSAGMFMSEYRGAYAKLAHETNALFIPSIMAGIVTNPSMKSDFLHPNAKGYFLIASRISEAINPYLSQK